MSQLSVHWYANNKAWMTQTIFKDWVDKLNSKMKSQNRKILLTFDNATCHSKVTLSNIDLLYLPPNTTSVCQPLDLGIIRNFKLIYQKRVLKTLLAHFETVESIEELRINAVCIIIFQPEFFQRFSLVFSHSRNAE